MATDSLLILGSTGSIGRATLDVVTRCSAEWRVEGLAAGGQQIPVLAEQIRTVRPRRVAVPSREAARALERLGPFPGTEVLAGPDAAAELVRASRARVVVAAMVGSAGVRPVWEAVRRGRRVALANKESLVVAGEIIMAEAARSGAEIIPVDSEHSAIFQCLMGQRRDLVRRLILTASGGAFREWSVARMARATPAQALRHPKWRMGPKITVDSATLMNKGLEIIEARWLFGLPGDKIDVLVHPDSVVHSLVEFCDGSVIAQLGVTDMRIPIQFALYHPERRDVGLPPLDLAHLGRLSFTAPDHGKYPSLDLAKTALALGGSAPAVLNGANEVAVQAFLDRRITLGDLFRILARVMDRENARARPIPRSLDDYLAADQRGRLRARRLIGKNED